QKIAEITIPRTTPRNNETQRDASPPKIAAILTARAATKTNKTKRIINARMGNLNIVFRKDTSSLNKNPKNAPLARSRAANQKCNTEKYEYGQEIIARQGFVIEVKEDQNATRNYPPKDWHKELG